MFEELEGRAKLAAMLQWVARNMLRIKDFNFSSPSPFREQIDGTVDYIRECIDNTLEEGLEDS